MPNTICNLLCRNPFGKCGDQRRHFNVDRDIRFDFCHRKVKHLETAHVLANVHGEFHATHVLVVGIPGGAGGVTHDRVGLHGLDALNQVVPIDKGYGSEQAGLAKINRSVFFAVFDNRLGSAVAFKCRLDHAVGRYPKVVHPSTQCKRRSNRCGACHVPGIAALEHPGGALFAGPHQRHCAAAIGLGAIQGHVLTQCSILVVHHAREHRHIGFGPSRSRQIGLAENPAGSAGVKLEAFK